MSLLQSPKIFRLLLFALLAISSSLVRAQIYIVAPVSPLLSPSLNDRNPTNPMTNLNYDLLVPPRPTLSDPTGAYIFATSLNPIADNFTLTISPSQTDTALRGAAQVGQLNSARLSQLLGTSGTAMPDDLASTAALGRSRIGAAISSSGGDGSSWGGSSADFQSGAGNFGATDLSNQRMGERMGESATEGGGRGMGLSGSGVPTEQDASSDKDFQSLPMAMRGAGRISGAQLRSGLPGTVGATPAAGSDASTLLGRASASSRSHVEAIFAGGEPSPTATGGAGRPSASGRLTDAPQTLEGLLLFSPRSYLPYSFGESPFASPGQGERTFLKPDIFNTTRIALSSKGGGTAEERRQRLRGTLNGSQGLPGDASGYGLTSNLGRESRPPGTSRSRKSGTSNSYRSGPALGSGLNQ